jgi:hypothetical protein
MMLSRCSIKPVTIADISIYELLHKLNHPVEDHYYREWKRGNPPRDLAIHESLLDGNGSTYDE